MNTLLPAVIETAVKPKPTKSELVEAMARLHIQKCKDENLANEKKRKEIRVRIEKAGPSLARKWLSRKEAVSVSYGMWSRGSAINVSISIPKESIPSEIVALIREENDLPGIIRIPSLHESKAKVRQIMSGVSDTATRVKALLDSPECVRAMESLLGYSQEPNAINPKKGGRK